MSAERVFVHAIIVTYFPEVAVLDALLRALEGQVQRICIVDNTPSADDRVASLLLGRDCSGIDLVRLGSNLGIARALNVGMEHALSGDSTHILLSDQDSLPAPDMVAGLLQGLQTLEANGEPIGAIGPTYTDRHTKLVYPFQVHRPGKLFYGHGRPNDQKSILEVLTLITSGTLMPVGAARQIGPMLDEYFIDQVDIEWSHRARHMGYKLFGTSLGVMYHSMGDDYLDVWYFGWRRESAYSPIRVYYRIRNFVALCRVPWIDVWWKVRSTWYCLGFFYSQVFFGKQARSALRMAWRGLCDGLRGRMGAFSD